MQLTTWAFVDTLQHTRTHLHPFSSTNFPSPTALQPAHSSCILPGLWVKTMGSPGLPFPYPYIQSVTNARASTLKTCASSYCLPNLHWLLMPGCSWYLLLLSVLQSISTQHLKGFLIPCEFYCTILCSELPHVVPEVLIRAYITRAWPSCPYSCTPAELTPC